MERRHGDLEAKAHKHEQAGHDQYRRGIHHAHLRQIQCAPGAVQVAEAKQEKARGHAAEREILERGFSASAAVLQGGEGVEAKADQFQCHKRAQQITAGDHQAHAHGAE